MLYNSPPLRYPPKRGPEPLFSKITPDTCHHLIPEVILSLNKKETGNTGTRQTPRVPTGGLWLQDPGAQGVVP